MMWFVNAYRICVKQERRMAVMLSSFCIKMV